MKSHFRNVDWCCRFGGEEFCVVLPTSNVSGTMYASERFRELVESMDCDGLHITVSIGVSNLSNLDTSDDPQALINQADKALYQAKEAGRNQVKLYCDSMK